MKYFNAFLKNMWLTYTSGASMTYFQSNSDYKKGKYEVGIT